MSIRNRLEKQFPLGSTEHHYYIASNAEVSMEGFIKKIREFFRNRRTVNEDTDTHSESTDSWEWLTQNFRTMDIDTVSVSTGDVTVPARYAPFCQRGGRTVSDLSAEVAKDLKQYRQLLSQNKMRLLEHGKYIHSVHSELSKFLDRYPGIEYVNEFVDLVKRQLNRAPRASTLSRFQEPTHKFLGFSKSPFTIRESGQRIFAIGSKPDKAGPITITFDSTDQVRSLLNLIRELLQLSRELSDLEEASGIGVDMTDPPWRGYWEEVADMLETAHIPYFHPTFDESNSNLATELDHRVAFLAEAMVSVVRHLVKED